MNVNFVAEIFVCIRMRGQLEFLMIRLDIMTTFGTKKKRVLTPGLLLLVSVWISVADIANAQLVFNEERGLVVDRETGNPTTP